MRRTSTMIITKVHFAVVTVKKPSATLMIPYISVLCKYLLQINLLAWQLIFSCHFNYELWNVPICLSLSDVRTAHLHFSQYTYQSNFFTKTFWFCSPRFRYESCHDCHDGFFCSITLPFYISLLLAV